MKYLLILILCIPFTSCKTNDCQLLNYERVRKVEIQIDTESEKSLNNITDILHKGRYLYTTIESENSASRTENEIFFNLDQDKNSLHIRVNYYKKKTGIDLLHYMNFDVPINQIDSNKIVVTYFKKGGVYYDYANLTIGSKFNNPNAFKIQLVSIDSGNEKVNQCITDESFDLNVKSEDAEILKSAITEFLKNYKT